MGTNRPYTSSLQRLRPWLMTGVVLLNVAASAMSANAGCGCEKPPPRAAAVRPNATYSGQPVTIFSSALLGGQSYDVTFSTMNGTTATVRAQAAAKRDLADAVTKTHLSVILPTIPLGPASIKVTAVGATLPLLTVADAGFTVAPQPIALPTAYGNWTYPGSQAAVGRDGVVYLSLDLTGMTDPLVFEAEFAGYPLRFAARDLVFTNTQGFLMQLLVQPATGQALPGMFVYPAATPTTTSDRLHYSRHEFNTYFLQHQERLPHAVDATDDNWHLDGTRHIDHDHLIVAIMGRKNDGTFPAPGATPVFDLKLRAYSLFYQGLVGDTGISMSSSATADSFDPTTGLVGQQSKVLTNGALTMSGTSTVRGDAAAASFSVGSSALVTGTRTTVSSPTTFMAVKVPAGIPTLADIALSGDASRTIVGPGSFFVNKVSLSHSDSRLYIDNTAGPVTLYVNEFKISAGTVATSDANPEKFAVYLASTKAVAIKGGDSNFYGVLYAPQASVSLTGTGTFVGAFMGKSLSMSGTSRARYDQTLRGH